MTPMKTILITGAAGFLGSNLADQLCKDNNNTVIGLDNFITGTNSNINQLQQYSNFKFIEHDIINPIYIPVDQIYNLACPASPPQYQKYPVFTINSCVVGMKNMLDLAQKTNATILQASTSEVYGDPKIHPQHENYWGNVNSYGPRSCYDEGKRCAESLCWSYSKELDVDVRIARIFNTYGPNMDKDDGRVVSNFIMAALHNKPLQIYGDPGITRSFCYVTDNINGLELLMNSGTVDPVNIGNPTEITLEQLAHTVLELTNSGSSIEITDRDIDTPIKRKPNIDRARQQLGWHPAIDLHTGLGYTIEYFRNI